MLPFATGITGYYAEEKDGLTLKLHCLRNLQVKTFRVKDKTVINTIKSDFSPILEDYLGDSLPGFSDAFMEMQSQLIPSDGEEREFHIAPHTKAIFCWVPAGKATLGSPESEGGRFKDETEHEFETKGFWMGKYPVTQLLWEIVMCADPSTFRGDNLPVEQVNWHHCQDFIRTCNIFGLNIPHEDQWEYACRGGKGNKQPFYWGDFLSHDKANWDQTEIYGATKEVGSYEKISPHPWGLCDMHGNVREWCENVHNVHLQEKMFRTVRGGGWKSPSIHCRSAYRGFSAPWYADSSTGFRLIIC